MEQKAGDERSGTESRGDERSGAESRGDERSGTESREMREVEQKAGEEHSRVLLTAP